jgi:hypothetical protein
VIRCAGLRAPVDWRFVALQGAWNLAAKAGIRALMPLGVISPDYPGLNLLPALLLEVSLVYQHSQGPAI